MEISIQKGEGISQAIKRQLDNEGYQDRRFTASIWSQIQKSLNDGFSVLKHGGKETKIGELWTTLNQRVMTYVNDALMIAESTWESIRSLVSSAPQSTTSSSGTQSSGTQSSGGNNGVEDSQTEVAEPKITLQEKKCDYVVSHTKEGKAKAKELRALLSKSVVPMSDVREILESKNNKNIIAYIVQEYPELANDIDDVFRFGFGFDKKDVYEFVLNPLVTRAKELGGINIPEGISENLSLQEMDAQIKTLSKAIIEAEKKIDSENAEYNGKLDESQKRIDNATSILTTAANSESLNIVRFEASRKKYCRLSDGTYVWASYDNSGKICGVQIDTDDKDDITDVSFTSSGVSFDDDENPTGSFKYKNCPANGYNYNDILALAQKIFGDWDD